MIARPNTTKLNHSWVFGSLNFVIFSLNLVVGWNFHHESIARRQVTALVPNFHHAI